MRHGESKERAKPKRKLLLPLVQKYIIGSVSHGTMRTEDLIPRFMPIVRYFDESRANQLQEELDSCLSDEDKDYFLNETLFDVLNEFAPPYFYFGSHIGDGADYGFWLSEGFEDEFDGLKVNDLSELDLEDNKDYCGEVLLVNDRGNCTLYSKNKNKLKEIWSVI